MNGKTLLAEAIEMKDEIVENRRAIHRTPEVGAHLPQTVQFVEEKLRLLGYEPRELGDGVPEFTCSAIAACGSGASSTPALSIAFAPVKPSSSGWKTSFTVPLSSL